jgi:hypothetical protein
VRLLSQFLVHDSSLQSFFDKTLHEARVKYTLSKVLADYKCSDTDGFKSLKAAIRGRDPTVANALRRVLPPHVASALRSLCDRDNGKITLGALKVHNVSTQLTVAVVLHALNGGKPISIVSPYGDRHLARFDAKTLRQLLGTDAFVADDLPNLARAIVLRLAAQFRGASHACVVAVRSPSPSSAAALLLRPRQPERSAWPPSSVVRRVCLVCRRRQALGQAGTGRHAVA